MSMCTCSRSITRLRIGRSRRGVSALSIVCSERNAMTLTDKTGAPVTISGEPPQFTISVDGKTVGLEDFAERDGQRVFYHTEIDDAFGGRGLGTVLIAEALAA